jgi:FkbM family methyltransferase
LGIPDRIETFRQIWRHPGNNGRRAAAFRDYVRWNIGVRLLGADHVLPLIDDARIIVSARQNYATLTYVNRLWDFADMMFLLHLLRPEDRFGDLGSNVGGYTILAARVVGCRCVAFEPVPATFAELQANLRLNDATALVEAQPCGLGAEHATLRMTASLGGMNHIATERSIGDTVEVPVRRLDDVLVGRPLNLIKLDAEGFELNILAGAQATLANPELHAVIVELNGSGLRYGFSDDDVDAELRRMGFAPYAYDPATRCLRKLPTYNRVDFNTLYLRPSDHVTKRLATARAYDFRGAKY